MDYEFDRREAVDVSPGQAQPKYEKLVMREGRFYLQGTLPTGASFSVQLGPSDASSEPPARQPSTSSAASRSISGDPATSSVVTIDSRQASRSSRIFSRGPMSASSSTSRVGSAAPASSLRPSR